MSEPSGDRRVRRTKKLLMRSLTKLMTEKKINKITVTELTELADVNRSTFYLYYRDIYDMIDKIETEMFEEFNLQLKKLYISDPNRENTLSFFVFVFEFVRENADICKILLGQDGDYTFLNKFKEAIMESQPPNMNKLDQTANRYFMPFAVSGCIGAIQQWLQEDMVSPPREIAEFIIGLIMNGLKCYNIDL
jgi:AcrR family transcriptional regulator